MAGIELKNVTKHFGDVLAVSGVDLRIPDGSITVLVGPSGCGKTTTLRMIVGLETVSEGEVWIGDRNVTRLEPKERDVAMVFQNYALYPHMTVYDNIAFGLRAHSMPESEIDSRVKDVSRLLEIGELLERKPDALSGGQQQRVAIGRSIVREPAAFLFDEPLSNLDAKLRVEMRSELLRLHKQRGTTMVYVTHDQEEAMTLADQIVVMHRGRIAQQGTPEEVYLRPANDFVARFIGSPQMNMIEGRLSENRFRSEDLDVEVPLEGTEGEVKLGIRPEDVHLAGVSADEGIRGTEPIPARVELIELLGSRAFLTLVSGEQRIRALLDARLLGELREEQDVEVIFDRDRLHFFDPRNQERLPEVSRV